MNAVGESFAFETDVSIRYNDVDAYGHVNNATYATYLEEARIDYLDTVLDSTRAETDALAGLSEGGIGMVVAGLELTYHRPVGLVDTVTVGVQVPHLGESSFPIEYEIRTGGDVCAVGGTTMVAYDRTAESSCPIPDDWRERITAFEGL